MKKLTAKFNEMKLNRQFTVMMFIILVIPVVVLSSVLFENMRGMLAEEKTAAVRREMEQTRATAEKAVELCNMTTQVFLNNFNLRVFLSDLSDGKKFSTEYLVEFDRNIIDAFERLVISNPYLYQARVFSVVPDGPEMMPVLYNSNRMQKLSWARTARKSGKWQFNVTDELFPENVISGTKHIMSLVTDINDYERGRIGVLDVSVEMDGLLPALFAEDNDKWACFAASDGSAYASESGVFAGLRNEILAVPDMSLTEPQYITTKIGGLAALVAAVPIKVLDGWYIEVSSLEDINTQTRTGRNVFVLSMFALAVILAITVNLLVKAMLGRIYRIFETIAGAGDDNYIPAVPDPGGGEVGEAGRQVAGMLERINQLTKENINRQMLEKNSEIRALQNQINAHFIYNVLESVKMMAEVEGHYAISDTITSFGKLLRYSMRWTSGKVTTEAEVDYIKNYLALMNLRFDYQITLLADIPDRILKQQIPKLSLQPIIENAVVHGLAEQMTDTQIRIKSREYKDFFTLEISDRGCGMSREQLNELELKISGEIETGGGSGNGIGLKNVRDRIAMAFGEQYGLSLESQAGEYMKVSVKLPYTTDNEVEKTK